MGYQVITGFPGGLDYRKYKLSLPPGTLTELINAHITQGAEIEKRKAFGRLSLPSGTFLSQETLNGITVFGSRDTDGWTSTITYGQFNFGGSYGVMTALYNVPLVAGVAAPQVGDPVTISGSSLPGVNGDWTIAVVQTFATAYTVGIITGAAAGTDTGTVSMELRFPSPATYQRLQHPLGSQVNMTAVTRSSYFNGSVYAVTTWSNGDTLVFKDATVLNDFYVGGYGSIEKTAFSMANDICDAAEASGLYTAVKPTLSALYFQISGGTVGAGNEVGSVRYDFGRTVVLDTGGGSSLSTSNVELLTSVVAFNTDNATTATDVKTNIDANSYGFTIVVSSNKITITPPATDLYGNALGTNELDSLAVLNGGDVTTYTPEPSATFDLLSIPSDFNVPQFSVDKTVTGCALAYKLISNGVQPTAPSGAIGQIQISAGTPNAAAVAQIAYTASQPTDGSTITIGAWTYTFRTTITGVANEVKIADTPTATLLNLIAAVNNTSGAGTAYSATTLVNTDCSASAITGGHTVLTATLGGTVGNSLSLAQSGAFFTLTAFSGGGPDTNKVSSITVAGTDLLQGTAVPFTKDVATLVNDLVAGINANQGITNFSASSLNSVISLVANDPGTTHNSAEVVVTCAGNVCAANCFFTIVPSVSGTDNVSVIAGNGATNMLTATITYRDAGHTTESIEDFVGRIASNLNANTATSGYLCCNIGKQMFISKVAVSSSDTPENIEVTASTTVSLTVGTPTAMTIKFGSSQYLSWIQHSGAGSHGGLIMYYTSSGAPNSALLQVTGGVAPYTYKWRKVSGAGTPQVSDSFLTPGITTKNYQWWQIGSQTQTVANAYSPAASEWVCDVTDAANQVKTSDSVYIS